jgi:hypothetical protein
MNTPSTGFQQYGEGLLNKFQSSRIGQMFGGKSRKNVDEQNDNQESVQKGNKKDPKYTAVPPGKVEKLKINESESDILANMYNFMVKNYKRDLARMKKDKKYRKDVQEFEDIRNKQLVSGLKEKNKKEIGPKSANKGFSVGSLLKGGLKAGLAVGGLLLVGKAFAKMSEFDIKDAIPDITKIFKDPEKPEAGVSTGGIGEFKTSGTPQALQAFDFFIKQGWTPEQAAGIVGNLQAESGKELNIKAVGDKDKKTGEFKAFGIAQFHPERQELFKKKFGKDIRESTFEEQLQFVQHELETTEKPAADKLRRTKTVEEAATVVDVEYERSSGIHRQKRIANAQQLLTRPEGNNKVAVAPEPKIDDKKLSQINQDKLNEKKNEVVNLVKNNVIVVEKTKTVNTAEEVDDTSIMLQKIRGQVATILR